MIYLLIMMKGIRYYSITEAKEELLRRRKNQKLRKMVKNFLGEVPPPLARSPRAVIGRSVIVPNHEVLYFIDIAHLTKLRPLVLEDTTDRFVTNNRGKMCIVKPRFYKNLDKAWNIVNTAHTIVRLEDVQGKRFNQISTVWGENIVLFYHNIVAQEIPHLEIFEDVQWYQQTFQKTVGIKEYYKYYLAFFIRHGILFENFIEEGYEQKFTTDVVIPAAQYIHKIFGHHPLIVRLLPQEESTGVYWDCLPDKYLKNYFDKM